MGEIGVGIIGTGFMGECHALAFTAVGPVFQPTLRPRLEMVADIDEVAAQRARARFGFARATGDWRALVADPAVELVSITRPMCGTRKWRWPRSAPASTSTARSRWH